jgi:hypothetical protein
MSNHEPNERQALHIDEKEFGRKYTWQLPGKLNIKVQHYVNFN